MQCLLELSWLLLSAVGPFAAKFCVLVEYVALPGLSLRGHRGAGKECFPHVVVACAAESPLRGVAPETYRKRKTRP